MEKSDLYALSTILNKEKQTENWYNIVGETGLCVAENTKNGRIIQQKCGESSKVLWKSEVKGNKIIFVLFVIE